MPLLEDILIFQNILETIEEPDSSPSSRSRIVTEVGRYFLEADYAGKTLEQDGPERLVVNLRCFDCFTFVENCLALAWLIPSRKHTWNDYTVLLAMMRYHGGIPDGYASRLHYFSDWLGDNIRKGYLQDVTGEFQGRLFTKQINFMTKNPDLYAPLADPAILNRMAEIEAQLSGRELFFIPVGQFDNEQRVIREGDIIGITTSEEGLDVCHAGLAVRSGRSLHLLHASREAGKVIISPETLGDYLRASDTRTGVMVGRISEDL